MGSYSDLSGRLSSEALARGDRVLGDLFRELHAKVSKLYHEGRNFDSFDDETNNLQPMYG